MQLHGATTKYKHVHVALDTKVKDVGDIDNVTTSKSISSYDPRVTLSDEKIQVGRYAFIGSSLWPRKWLPECHKLKKYEHVHAALDIKGY